MQEELPLPNRGVIHDISVGVLADVGVQKPGFVVLDLGIALF
jgi:hypothetical protein